jgi:lipopolysaccharide export system permease protein
VRQHTAYILKILTGTASMIAVALAGVVWLSQSLRFLDFIINKGLSVLSFLRLTVLLLPTVFSVILPVAVLCAVIYSYNRLIADRELVVMRAVGLSPWDLAKPALLLAVVVCALGYANTLYLMPAGFRTFKDQQVTLREDFSHILLQEGMFNSLGDDLVVYVRSRETNGTLHGILVHDTHDPTLAVTMMAETGALVNGPAGPVFLMNNGNRQEVRVEDRALRMLYFDSYSLDLSPLTEEPEDRYREPKERFLHELWRKPVDASEEQHRSELLAEGHRRLVAPLNAIPLALIGVAAMLSGEFNRRRQWPRIAAGTIAGLIYIGLTYTLAGMLNKNPIIVPFYYALPVLASGLALIAMGRERLPRLMRRRATAA